MSTFQNMNAATGFRRYWCLWPWSSQMGSRVAKARSTATPICLFQAPWSVLGRSRVWGTTYLQATDKMSDVCHCCCVPSKAKCRQQGAILLGITPQKPAAKHSLAVEMEERANNTSGKGHVVSTQGVLSGPRCGQLGVVVGAWEDMGGQAQVPSMLSARQNPDSLPS